MQVMCGKEQRNIIHEDEMYVVVFTLATFLRCQFTSLARVSRHALES